MLRSQMTRHRMGMFGLVVARLVKTDGESFHRAAALRLHQRHDGGGIDAARQKSAHSK